MRICARHVLSPATFFLLASLVFLPIRAHALEEFQFTETKAFEVGAAPGVNLETVAGDVSYTVSEGTQATVTVLTVVRAKDEAEAADIRQMVTVELTGKPGLLEARADHPDDFWRRLRREFGRERSISISFAVTGPAGAEGFLSSVSGNASVDGAAGPFDVQSVSGTVLVKNVQGRVNAGSVSGNCEVTDCADRVRANAVSGSVTVRGGGRDARIETVSGDVIADDISAGADITTVSGSVEVTGIDGDLTISSTSGNIDAGHKQGAVYARTISGDIRLSTASSEGLIDARSVSGTVQVKTNLEQLGHLDLSTFSGDIRVDSEIQGKIPARKVRGTGTLSLTIGEGGLDIQIDTQSGDIRLGSL